MVASVNFYIANGLGRVGIGCVGHGCSPGKAGVVGTLVSFTGNTGLPVTRSSTNNKPSLVGWAIASIFLPLWVTVKRLPGQGRSRSHISWWIVWKCHKRLPVFASSA